MYTVEFNKLPGFNNLFLDYISHNEKFNKKLSPYYFADYKEYQDIEKVIQNKSQNYNANRYFDKNVLIDILQRQNVAFGGTELTASNIELLKDDKTFAVVTGQQVGLYTGNLYTIYKLVTAIKLTSELKNRFPDYNFVPIFWLESDDHDFDEANHVFVINRQNELVRIGYEAEVRDESEETKRSLKPVGSMKLDNKISEINEELRHSLIDTDFKEALLTKINSFYTPENNFKSSFAGLLNWIFEDYGPIIIDCSDVEVKKLLTPVFEKELTTSPKLCESIITTSAELEHNYDLQVKPKVINLFFIHNENRLLIEPRENNRFALRNSKRRFEHDEIMNILFENPEYFSPNVVLRPISQDYLLPTVAYVGGPSEVSYFAQLKPAYEHYDITMPVIYPRASVTIVENKINKFLKNFNIDFTDVFHHKTLLSKVADKLSEVRVEDEITRVQDDFNRIFYELKNTTSKIDRTLQNSLEHIKEKLNANLEVFKGKLINAQASKSDTSTKQIDKVINNLYPDHKLQERILNVTYFLNKYSGSFIKKLFDEIDVNNFNHQVIEF